MIIAFMGFDGTGKTTVIKPLLRELGKLNEVEYHPGFDFVLVQYLKKAFLGKGEKEAQEKFLKKGDRKKPFSFKIWPFLVFLDCLLSYLQFKLSKRGKVVIFDRYFYDFLISYEYLGYSNWLLRKLFLFLPKPDIAFVLDVAPKIAYERKKETHQDHLGFYEEQRERYLQLAEELEIKVVNTEKPLQETLEEVSRKIQKIL